ncbi:uncharacterized protein LOC129028692 [Pongo pygmaeus]|uniref:uncharacterized protein LOC129028692 n=1 Tax=Pongo pygmaeus TaxID=9600 RepID=UPI00300D11DC
MSPGQARPRLTGTGCSSSRRRRPCGRSFSSSLHSAAPREMWSCWRRSGSAWSRSCDVHGPPPHKAPWRDGISSLSWRLWTPFLQDSASGKKELSTYAAGRSHLLNILPPVPVKKPVCQHPASVLGEQPWSLASSWGSLSSVSFMDIYGLPQYEKPIAEGDQLLHFHLIPFNALGSDSLRRQCQEVGEEGTLHLHMPIGLFTSQRQWGV